MEGPQVLNEDEGEGEMREYERDGDAGDGVMIG